MTISKQSLIPQLDRLERPTTYSEGLPTPVIDGLPKNLLVFSRSDRGVRPRTAGPISHDRYLLVISLEGEGDALVDGTRVKVRPDSAVLILPYQLHYFDVSDQPMNWLMLGFEHKQRSDLNDLGNKTLKLPEDYLNTLSIIAKNYKCNDAITFLSVSICIYQVASLISQLHIVNDKASVKTKKSSSKQDQLVDKVHRYIHHNLDSPLSLRIISENFDYSESHLRRLYREEMGFSLGVYVREAKLNYARVKLLTTQDSIQSVAMQCGFGSVYAFSNAFKLAHDQSPRAFRQRILD